jgi:hypothetical protein
MPTRCRQLQWWVNFVGESSRRRCLQLNTFLRCSAHGRPCAQNDLAMRLRAPIVTSVHTTTVIRPYIDTRADTGYRASRHPTSTRVDNGSFTDERTSRRGPSRIVAGPRDPWPNPIRLFNRARYQTFQNPSATTAPGAYIRSAAFPPKRSMARKSGLINSRHRGVTRTPQFYTYSAENRAARRRRTSK